MQKEEINQRDTRFVQKLAEIRDGLFERQKKHRSKRKLSYSLLAISLVAILTFYAFQALINKPPSSTEQMKPTQPAGIRPEASPTAVKTFLPPEKGRTEVSSTKESVESPVAPEQLPKPKVEAPKATPEATAESQVFPSDLRIREIAACKSVVQRRLIGEQYVFSVHDTPKSFVWMDVRSTRLPRKLKHVYYYRGLKYCEVSLDILYPRMRTWSNLTLKAPDHVGPWRVDVVDESGAVLKQITFQVTP
jgi:hypothetical protein